MTRHTLIIALAAALLLPAYSAIAQDPPSRASMLTGSSNPPPPAENAEAEAAAAQAEAEKAAQEEANAQPQPAPAGQRGERGCKDAEGNPREC